MGLVVLGSVSVLPQAAQAGKAPKSFAFDTTIGAVEVATVYETSYAAQKGLVKSLKLSSKLMKKGAGFKGFSTLQSADGAQVVVLSQWQDLASYQAYAAPAGEAAVKQPDAAPIAPSPTRSLIFEVQQATVSFPNSQPALRGKEAVVQFVELVPKNPEDQAQILTQLEAVIPALLQKQPIPQSIVLLKGKDSSTVALLTNWNCSALFEDVGQPTAIALSEDLATLTTNDQHLYNVVNIMPGNTKKPKEEKSE